MGNVVDKNKKLLSLAGYPVGQNYERLTVLSVRELPHIRGYKWSEKPSWRSSLTLC